MEIKTFRAKTMPQALDLVRRELGPEAMVLHTRELNSGLLSRMLRGRAYEIAATPQGIETSPPAPSPSWGWEQPSTGNPKSPERRAVEFAQRPGRGAEPYRGAATPPHQGKGDNQGRLDVGLDLTNASSHGLQPPASSLQPSSRLQPSSQLAELQSLIEQLRARSASRPERDVPPLLFDLFTDMIEADIDEAIARELLDRLRREPADILHDPSTLRLRLSAFLEAELRVAGPIPIEPGAGRVVALVGPTGVGKTTTIAKLAANYRLRDNRRVGLITVDTYRIAAVEQLRTYADIIDLPMEVVSTPREMREACQRMRDFDLVLMDTAGRSPRDEVRIRELRSMLAEATPDEVHLVLSAATSARSLVAAAQKFAPVGVTSLIVTKLDEATGLGNLLSLARECTLPFSYLTDGQNVPDDIAVADVRALSQLILDLQTAT